MIFASDAFIKAMKAPIKQLYIKIQIFDKNFVFIKEITKDVTTGDIGSISCDATRAIRRSFSFSLNNNNNAYDFGDSGNLIWIDKRIKLFIGLKLPDGTIEYIPQGVFVLTEPSHDHTLQGKKAHITGQDLGFLLTNTRGKFLYETTITANTNISSAIRTIASVVGITQFNFDAVADVTSFDMTFQASDNRWKAIEDLAKLAKCDVYFDVFGNLRLRKIDLNEIDSYPAVWTFKYGDETEKFYAGMVRKLDESTFSNHIVVLGGNSQIATQRYELKVSDSDPLWTGNSYTIEKVGDVIYHHNSGSPDPLLGGATNDACKWRAKFELRKRCSLAEKVSLQLAPFYLLEPNDVIDIENGSVTGKYLVQNFSIPINPQIMTVECLKNKRIITDWNFI